MSTKQRPPVFSTTVSSFTNATDEQSWSTSLVVFEVIEIHLIVITVWMLACLVIYGTKAGKWTKKARASSLNSGFVYTASVITIAIFVPKLASTEVLFHSGQITNGENWCELLGDISTTGYGLCLYATYLFLSIRQRLIYTHPCVRHRVSKCMDWFSRIFFVILTAVAIGLVCVFWYPNSYKAVAYGCVEDRTDVSSIILAVVFVATQTMVLVLSIYPAVQVKIETNVEPEASSVESYQRRKSISLRAVFTWCRPLFCGGGEIAASPVELTIRRTVVNCVAIIVSDLAGVIVETVILPADAPVAIRQTTTDIGLFINVFCVLATFGFAGRVLTLCWPTCPKIKTRKTEEMSIATVDAVVEV